MPATASHILEPEGCFVRSPAINICQLFDKYPQYQYIIIKVLLRLVKKELKAQCNLK